MGKKKREGDASEIAFGDVGYKYESPIQSVLSLSFYFKLENITIVLKREREKMSELFLGGK